MIHRITALASIASIALTATAASHPGPPGHIHSDEWPFELIALIATVIALLFLARLMTRKS